MLHGHLNGSHPNKIGHQLLLPCLHGHVFLVEVVDEAVEDGKVVEIIGAGFDVPVDEGEQFEVELLSLFHQLY